MVKALENEKNGKSRNDSDDMEMETMVHIFEASHGILMDWRPNETRYYYELMKQHSTK